MAQQVLPIIGGIVGFIYGGPTGAQIGFMIGGGVAALTAPPSPGPRLGDLPVQSFDEGTPRAIIYGTSQTTGYVIAAGPSIKTTEITDAGGKGGGSVEGEVAYRSYAIAMCEGPIAAVLRVWADDKLVYDVRPESLILAESQAWVSNKVFYMGTEDQLPDVFLQNNVSFADTPAYRGTAYMVVGLEDLTDRRGTIPMYRFEVTTQVTSTPLSKVPSLSVLRYLRNGGIPANTTWQVNAAQDALNERVMRLAFEIKKDSSFPTGEWGPEFTATATVRVGGQLVFTRSFSSDTFTYVQVNGLGEPVIANIVVNNLAATGLPRVVSQVYQDYPNPVQIGAGYTAYYGGGEAPLVILPEAGDIYYGVLNDGGEIKSASWGPDFLTESGGPTTLDVIVADLCERSGLAPDDFDVSELNDTVNGLTLAGDYTAASAIDVPRACYFFDKCEPGDKLYFPKRGKAVALTLDIDDLVEIPDLSRREQATEVPRKIHLHYANATAGYAPIKSTYMRSSADIQSTLETTVQVPVVLDTDQAAQMVEKMFKVTTADAQGEIKISVPDSFMRLVPSDCIGLNLRGQVRRLRIDDIEMADGVMHLTCRADRQSAYSSVLTGIPVDPPTVPPSTIPGDTVFAVMDIPARVDSEDDLNYLVAGTGEAVGWSGWAYQRSLDGGANFSTAASIGTAAIMGRLVDAVSDASPWYTDRVNVVRVQMIRNGQVLEDLTEQQFLSEGGAFALQGPTGWEVLQYRDAEDEGGGVFALSTLHRGQLNTEPTAHAAGDLFVMLDRATHIPAQAAWLGAAITHRGVSLGRSPEGAPEFAETFTGQSQREWPVASLRMTRSGDSITATWAPRHRFGSDDQPIASANFIGFRVTVTDGAATHTADVTMPSYTYSVAGMGNEIEVRVAALNRITGAGPEVSTWGEYEGFDPSPTGTAVGAGALFAASDAGHIVLLDAVTYQVNGAGDIGPVSLIVLEGDMGWFNGGTSSDSRITLETEGEPTGLACLGGVAYTSHIDRSAGAASVVSRVPFAGESVLAVSHTWTSLQPVTSIVAAHGKIWVADGYNGRIVMLDPSNLSELGNIAQPAYGVAANGTHIFAALSTQILQIDPATGAVIGPVYTHTNSTGVVFGVTDERLFVGEGIGMAAIDLQSGSELSRRSDMHIASPTSIHYLSPAPIHAGKIGQGRMSGPSMYQTKYLVATDDLRTISAFTHPNQMASALNGVRALVMLANGQVIASYSKDQVTNASPYVELFSI